MEVCAERSAGPRMSCLTLMIDDCQSRWEGEGDSRVWVTSDIIYTKSSLLSYYFPTIQAVIPGSCVRRPHQRCEETSGRRGETSLECRQVPQRRCRTARRCRRQECRRVPWTFCQRRPRKLNCRRVQRIVPKEVSRTVNIRNC